MSAVAAAAACTSRVDEPTGATGTSAEALSVYPEIDFSSRPSYVSNKTLALTFDDGPDYTNTAKVLDILKANKVKATFFINTQNWSNVDGDPPMQDLVRRMVNEGHELGNHTARHPHLATLSANAIEAELSDVETTVRNIFGANAPKLTVFRAPFGEPYQGNSPDAPGAGYNLVAPIVARHAVEIGWAIDTFDYNCPQGDGACVYNNFVSAVGGGAYGAVLMHSVHSQTVSGLQSILDYVRTNGYSLVLTDDLVRARFGKSSSELVYGTTTATDAGTVVPVDAAVDTGSTGACTAPAWNASTAYVGGAKVSYAGAEYTASYWNQNARPDTSNGAAGTGRPWLLPASCGGACAPSCGGRACGEDGCGGSCGTCASGQSCSSSGQCASTTVSCSSATPWDANKPWHTYSVGELHTGANGHVYSCKNVAYCIYEPTSAVGNTYGWTDKGPC